MNNSTIQIGPFKVIVNLLEGVTISKEEGNLKIPPADCESLIQLLMYVMAVESLKVLPSKLSNKNYQAKFRKNRNIEIVNTLFPNEKGLDITFAEGDNLIEAFKTGIRNFTDSTTLQGPPKSMVSLSYKEVPQDGR